MTTSLAVVDPSGDVFVVLDGVELPLTWGDVRVARRFQWYHVDRRFNKLFYRALGAAGYAAAQSQDAIKLILHHRRALGLSERQVRGAWGLRCGVFGENGKFRDPTKGSEVEAEESGGDPVIGFDEKDWPWLEADALGHCGGKPDQVDIAVEMRWIRSKLHEWPDFRSAPSVGAIKDWLTISKPGNNALMRDFLNEAWSKRLSPGEKKGKAKVFEEDRTEAAVDRDADAKRRLFGEALE